MQVPLLSEQISRQLLRELRVGAYAHVDRLPPEMEIAAHLSVSRTAVRDSLAALEREGFITRKHGVGTIVNHHVLAVRTRMDLEEEFLDMVRSAGYTPGVGFARWWEAPAPEPVARRLCIAAREPLIQVSRLITADGRPVIYCLDSFPMSCIRDQSYLPDELTRPIFYFLNRYCGIEVYLDLTEVNAVAAEGLPARALDVPPGTPLLHMDELGYDLRGHPVLHSDEYYADGILRHTVLRKKI